MILSLRYPIGILVFFAAVFIVYSAKQDTPGDRRNLAFAASLAGGCAGFLAAIVMIGG